MCECRRSLDTQVHLRTCVPFAVSVMHALKLVRRACVTYTVRVGERREGEGMWEEGKEGSGREGRRRR